MTLKSLHKKGFTLIELLVVIAIITILISVGAVSYTRSLKISRDAKRKTDIEQIRQALETYRSENGTYPTTGTWEASLEAGYISTIPSDPKPETYSYTYTQLSAYTYSVCYTLESPTPTNTCATEP